MTANSAFQATRKKPRAPECERYAAKSVCP